jgi:hypothetical protein
MERKGGREEEREMEREREGLGEIKFQHDFTT